MRLIRSAVVCCLAATSCATTTSLSAQDIPLFPNPDEIPRSCQSIRDIHHKLEYSRDSPEVHSKIPFRARLLEAAKKLRLPPNKQS